MKVIKNKYIKFPSLEDSIERLGNSFDGSPKSVSRLTDFELTPAEQQKRIRFFYVISRFNTIMQETDELDKTLDYLKNSLREIVPLKEAFLYVFDSNQKLCSLGKNDESAYTDFINKAYKNGILDWIFETGNISILPDITKSKSNSNPLNFVVLPIIKEGKAYGIYSILTPINALSSKSYEIEVIKIFLSLVQNKLDLAKQKNELASAYEDLQVLQSKLSNDFKYSAIGELTAGIVEDVMNPVQVILSCASFMDKEYDNIDKKVTGTLISQIKKIETVIKRLSKFVGTQNENGNLYPCIVNEPIKDYYEVVLSSLKYKNYECILDLDENLPPIVTRKNHIHQLLTNLFGMVLNSKVEGGGILIQTKFINDSIALKFIVTDRLNIYSDDDQANKANINFKMISNMMKRHQGKAKIFNNEAGGTSIILNFPIKRKLAK